MRIAEREIASKRPLIAHANIGDLRLRVCQCRRMLAHDRTAFERLMGDASADVKRPVVNTYLMQSRDFFDIDQNFRLQ